MREKNDVKKFQVFQASTILKIKWSRVTLEKVKNHSKIQNFVLETSTLWTNHLRTPYLRYI